MYLRRLELHGFKTFAQKTVLEFVPVAGERRGVTAIVGPNGSGKSNLADAIRWVMGEQSLKLLRSKKSEDVIFSGTHTRSRSGFAEATMTLVNEDETSVIDLPEICVTRRLYRDGQSEYAVNKQPARLTDIILLLAQCGIGQRTYSVIGQGMVDAVLSASPAERKEFFDEAAGLRVFQLKRIQTMNKFEAARNNLVQADVLLHEIEPRLTSLTRQVKRLKEREGIENELHEIGREYFGQVWFELKEKFAIATAAQHAAQKEWSAQNAKAEKLEQELTEMERAMPISQSVREIRETIDALKEERSALREKQIRCDSKREIVLAQQEAPSSPLPLAKILTEIDALSRLQKKLVDLLASDTPDLGILRSFVAQLQERTHAFLGRLRNPTTTSAPQKTMPHNVILTQEVEKLSEAIATVTAKIAESEQRLAEFVRQEEASRTHLFHIQRQLTAERHKAQTSERICSDISVEIARLETRRELFFEELRAHAPNLEAELDAIAREVGDGGMDVPVEELRTRMHKLRSQLEWIGGIDPTAIMEHEETKGRFESLTTQAEDLRQAMSSLETVIEELDTTIRERSEIAFKKIDHEFNVYFQKLFGGGEAKLIQLEAEPVPEDEDSENDERQVMAGIELHATPPGKRLKSIALLSGGERALTSIALICAILATNPSPFVVLDEVDAALDEANSKKFADILDGLADKTQFVIITHNRATMSMAHILYGVTMGDDGSSKVLSVKLT